MKNVFLLLLTAQLATTWLSKGPAPINMAPAHKASTNFSLQSQQTHEPTERNCTLLHGGFALHRRIEEKLELERIIY